MKPRCVLRAVLVFWLLVFSVLFVSTPNFAAEIQVGLDQVDITPPVGGRTTGYRSAQPTDGVHDPLSARVLILQSGDTTVALVSWDLCIINSPWLFEQVKPLGITNLLLMNTHTHAGPKLAQEDFPSAEEPWRRTVETRVLESIKRAQKNVFPARFAAGEGTIQLGYNRLVRQEGGYALTHFENPDRKPFGPVDPTVGVIRITDEEDRVRTVIVNYACHPVVLGPKNRKISAGYPGVTRRMVEEELGDGAVCIFVQGCCGDINPMSLARSDDRSNDFALVEQVGKELGNEVLKTLEGMKAVPGQSNSLAIASSEIPVVGRFDADKNIDLGVTSIVLNQNIGIMTMPGEPFVKFQMDLRQMAGLPHAYVFAYCCDGPYDWPSYLPDLVSAAHGGYGASDTTSAEVGAGERLLSKGLVQIYTLQNRLKAESARHTNK